MNTIYDLLASKLSDGELSDLTSAVYRENDRRAQSRVAESPPLNEEERILSIENKVNGIIAYRTRTGVDLRTSKAVVERFIDVYIEGLNTR